MQKLSGDPSYHFVVAPYVLLRASVDVTSLLQNGAENGDSYCETFALEHNYIYRAETEDASEGQEEDGHKSMQPT